MPSNMDDARPAGSGRGGSEALGYETRDANTSAVLGFLAVLFLVLVGTLFGTWLVFRYYNVAERRPAPGSSFAGVRQVPLGPELLVNPREDLLKTYSEQQQSLESYSWQNRKAGTVRVPIERAMDMLLQKGLPVVPGGTVDHSTHDDSSDSGKPAATSVHQKTPRGNN